MTVAQIFLERQEKWKKENIVKMALCDQREYCDPHTVADCAQPIYENLRKQEEENMVDPGYLQKVQEEIKDTSRAFLIEWIIDVHRKFRLVPESLYVTQHIIDHFLSKKKILKSQLHLLGVTTLHIAAKYEEIYPPDLRDFLQVSENKFTKQMVVDMEIDILTTLDFKVTAPSAYRFLQRYSRLSEVMEDKEVFYFAQYLQEISLLDVTLLRFRPSELAAASMILSARQLKKKSPWTKEVVEFTGYSEQALGDAIEEIKSFALEINPKFISTLKYKFSKPEYLNVS